MGGVVLIPSLNPNENLIQYVKDLFSFEDDIDVIVVNDGSDSNCDYIFNELSKIKHCHVIKHCVNQGKGRALKTGFNYYLNQKLSGGVVIADSDGQHSVKDVIAILHKVTSNEYDLILGVRDFYGKGIPTKSRLGNRITSSVIKLLYGRKIIDTQTGLRGFSDEYLICCLSIKGERFEYETEMLIDAIANNKRIDQHKIDTIYLDNNSGSHFNPFRDSYQIYKVILGNFIKFTFSSLSSALIDNLLFMIFVAALSKLPTFKYSITISVIMSRIVSSFYNYQVNAKIVFKSKTKNSIFKYYLLCIVQTTCSIVLLNLANATLQLESTFVLTIVKVIIEVFLYFVSYRIQQKYVFGRGDES